MDIKGKILNWLGIGPKKEELVIEILVDYDYNGFRGKIWVIADDVEWAEREALKILKRKYKDTENGWGGIPSYRLEVVECRVRSKMNVL